MKLVLAGWRGPKTPWADEALADYGRRVQRHFPFEELVLRGDGRDPAPLLKAVGDRGWLVALDERGEDRTSEQLAALLEQAAGAGVTRLVFAVGDAYGHPPEVRARAKLVLRLSAMVLNHAVARVVIGEQIYRACTIRAGEPYHHAG